MRSQAERICSHIVSDRAVSPECDTDDPFAQLERELGHNDHAEFFGSHEQATNNRNIKQIENENSESDPKDGVSAPAS